MILHTWVMVWELISPSYYTTIPNQNTELSVVYPEVEAVDMWLSWWNPDGHRFFGISDGEISSQTMIQVCRIISGVPKSAYGCSITNPMHQNGFSRLQEQNATVRNHFGTSGCVSTFLKYYVHITNGLMMTSV